MAILTYLLVAAVFAALFRRRIAASLRRRRLAAAHGCAPAARRWSLDPILNFDLSIEQMRWMKRGTRLKEYALRCYKGNHTIEYLEMGSRFVLTSDPRNAKAILTTDFANWGMGERRSLPFLDLIGLGILVNDGEAWSHSRKMIKPTFDRKRVSDRGALEPHVDRFMALLPRDGATVDMEPIIGRLILDVATQFVFGKSANIQIPGSNAKGEGFKKALDYVQVRLAMRWIMGPFKFLWQDAKISQSITEIHAFIDYCVGEALKDIKDRKGEEDEQPSLVNDLMRQGHRVDEVRYELMQTYTAAQDTSTTVLTNTLFLMARNPSKWVKLREELAGLGPEDLSFEGLKSLKYLQWVIKEVMRLHPPAPTTTRICLKETILPFGGGADGSKPMAVVPGDHGSIVFAAIHRRKDLYGDDADEFRPERWENLRLTWEFLAFSGGPRHCPGQQLASFWIAYTLARLAMVVETVENRDEVHRFVEAQGVTVKSRNGARVALGWA